MGLSWVLEFGIGAASLGEIVLVCLIMRWCVMIGALDDGMAHLLYFQIWLLLLVRVFGRQVSISRLWSVITCSVSDAYVMWHKVLWAVCHHCIY